MVVGRHEFGEGVLHSEAPIECARLVGVLVEVAAANGVTKLRGLEVVIPVIHGIALPVHRYDRVGLRGGRQGRHRQRLSHEIVFLRGTTMVLHHGRKPSRSVSESAHVRLGAKGALSSAFILRTDPAALLLRIDRHGLQLQLCLLQLPLLLSDLGAHLHDHFLHGQSVHLGRLGTWSLPALGVSVGGGDNPRILLIFHLSRMQIK